MSSTNGVGTTGFLPANELNEGELFTLYPKSQSGSDINEEAHTIELLEKYRNKSSWPRVRQRLLRYDTRSFSNKKKYIN
jgi:hypothetical protein